MIINVYELSSSQKIDLFSELLEEFDLETVVDLLFNTYTPQQLEYIIKRLDYEEGL